VAVFTPEDRVDTSQASFIDFLVLAVGTADEVRKVNTLQSRVE
jgi:hypothetical protein